MPLSTEAFGVLECWSQPRLDALAQAFVEAARRTRRRPMPVETRYRFPRGRSTDSVPIAAALTHRRSLHDVHLIGTVRFSAS